MKKFFRSRIDARIGGVCGGLSEFLDVDSTIIRLLFFAGIFTTIPVIIFYVGCWIMVPKRPYN